LLLVGGAAVFAGRPRVRALSLAEPQVSSPPQSATAREAAWRENNLGVSFLEQHKHEEAAQAFRRALAAEPTLEVARVNLALALFYVPDVPAAKSAATETLAVLPDSPHLHYLLGLVARLEDRLAEAEARMRKVLALDPGDLGANLGLGQVLIDRERFDEALPFLATAEKAEPWNVSVAYSRAMALARSGRREEGLLAMKRLQALRADPAHTTFGKLYLEQGRYGEAIASTGAEPGLVDRRPPAVTFAGKSDAVPARQAGAVTLALADLDGDGRLDVIEAGAQGVRLLRNEGGRFADVTARSGLSGPATAALAGDYDNDGGPDLLVVRPGGLALFRNEGGGRFAEATAAAKMPAAPGLPPTAAFADADHDGDLDAFVPGLLLRNNGDGTFTDVTFKAGVATAGRALCVVPTDFDNRRDLDLLVLRAAEGPALFQNLRDGSFQDVAARVGLAATGPFRSIAAADFNKDSYPDFFLGGAGASSFFALSDGRGRYAVKQAPPGSGEAQAAQAFDYDNDGLVDLLVAAPSGPRLFRSLGDGWAEVTEAAFPAVLRKASLGAAALGVADLDGDGDPDVLVATAASTRLWSNEGGNRNRSFALRLEGRASNKAGVGARIDLRAGSLRQSLQTSAAVPMASPADVLFGLGAREAPDAVRVIWISGIVQTETVFPAATTEGTRTAAALLELDRKPSSCPYLYAWSGERFELVTDFLGAGEMGYWLAPGVRSDPDPVEYVRIPPGMLRARGGRYELRVTNELEEVLYLDTVRLLAVEHAAGVEVYPDEGMTRRPKAFRLFAVRDARTPRVEDAGGADATERASLVDRRFVGGFRLHRLRGYAEEHSLTFDLSGIPETHRTLLLTGWTDYAFSSDNVAASQMGLALSGPRLELEAAPGAWEVAVADVGVPVGRPQTVVVDLAPLPLGPSARLRVATNMRIYWDRIAVAEEVPEGDLVPVELPLRQADLRERGFSAAVAAGGFEAFTFDYTRVSRRSPWKTMVGGYTREGDVGPLLAASDDLFVVSKPGDEVALSFEAPSAPGPGRARTLLLVGDGFSKEMDINSASPDVVLPLPYHGMTSYPYAMDEAPLRLRRRAEEASRWNTRAVARPLAPLEAAPACSRTRRQGGVVLSLSAPLDKEAADDTDRQDDCGRRARSRVGCAGSGPRPGAGIPTRSFASPRGEAEERRVHPQRRPPLRRDGLHGAPRGRDAQPRPHRAARRAPAQRLRHHLAVLPEPGDDPDRSLRPPAQGRGQQHAGAGGDDVLPAVPPARRLSDRVRGQVAHGRRAGGAPAGIRPLRELPGAGQLPAVRRRLEREREAGAPEGIHHRRAHRVCARLAEGARPVAALLPIPLAQGRPQRLRPGHAQLGLHPRRTASGKVREPHLHSAPEPELLDRRGGAAAALGEGPAEQLARRGFPLSQHPGPGVLLQAVRGDAAERRRERRPGPRVPGIGEAARFHPRHLHGGQRLRLRRARPHRQAHRVRGVDAGADGHAVSGAVSRRPHGG
jgi:Flp pilus assembly protein TadD